LVIGLGCSEVALLLGIGIRDCGVDATLHECPGHAEPPRDFKGT
jgi:hypothetical protein